MYNNTPFAYWCERLRGYGHNGKISFKKIIYYFIKYLCNELGLMHPKISFRMDPPKTTLKSSNVV